MIYKEKKIPAVLRSSAQGQLLQKAMLVHSDQASVISRAGMWHWSLHLPILHLRELNATFWEKLPRMSCGFAHLFSHLFANLFFFVPSDFAHRHRCFFSSQEEHWHGLCLTERVYQGGLGSASISLLFCIGTGCFPCNSWYEWIWDKSTRILTPASEATRTQTLTPWQRLSGLLSNSPSVWCGWR